MARPKYPKPDKNQEEIVNMLRHLGFDVDIIAGLPGLYDLVVSGERHVPTAVNSRTTIECSVRVEVKSGSEVQTDREMEYMRSQCARDSYIVAYNVKDVLRWFDGIVST